MLNKDNDKKDDYGVSPVIGIILIVAITVILAGVIGVFVLDIGDVDEEANAGISYDNGEVSFVHSGNAEKVEIYQDEELVGTLNNVGDTVSFTEEGEWVAIAVRNNVETVIINGYVPSEEVVDNGYKNGEEENGELTVDTHELDLEVISKDESDMSVEFTLDTAGNSDDLPLIIDIFAHEGASVAQERDSITLSEEGDTETLNVPLDSEGSVFRPTDYNVYYLSIGDLYYESYYDGLFLEVLNHDNDGNVDIASDGNLLEEFVMNSEEGDQYSKNIDSYTNTDNEEFVEGTIISENIISPFTEFTASSDVDANKYTISFSESGIANVEFKLTSDSASDRAGETFYKFEGEVEEGETVDIGYMMAPACGDYPDYEHPMVVHG